MSRPLAVLVSSELVDEHVAALRAQAATLASSRRWTQGPPELLDERMACSCSFGSEGMEIVGLVLSVTDATPREEVDAFLEALAAFSSAQRVELAIAYNQDFIGEIQDGVIGDGVRARI